MTYDVIVRNGLWFDGTGARPQRRTLGIRDGIVAAVSAEALDETGCPDVIDAAGKWVLPGFIDVHTHYDAEVLLDPGLASRCGTASPPCCLATARSRRCTRTPKTPPTCSAASKRCRASTCSARWRPRRHGRRPPNTSRRSTTFRSGRMSVPCWGTRTCAPRCSDWTAPPLRASSRRMPNSSGWRSCSTRRSTRACSACPVWMRRSTSSTVTASGHAPYHRHSPPGANAAG